MERTTAAPPCAGTAEESLGTFEVRQKVRGAPPCGPAVIGSRVAALIGERIDRTGAAHDPAAWTADDAASQPRLRGRQIAPVKLAALQLGPLLWIPDRCQLRLSAGLDKEHPSSSDGESMRHDATGRACTDNDVVVGRSELLRRMQYADAGCGPCPGACGTSQARQREAAADRCRQGVAAIELPARDAAAAIS